MTLGNGRNLSNFSCDDMIIKNNLSEKILGLIVDNNRDFSNQISNICQTANQKPNTFFRVSANMNSCKCSLLMRSFTNCHFCYYPLIWMFCRGKSIKKINK